MLAGTVFDPTTGMTPNDWRETEVRRAQSRQRVHNPYGREPSGRSRAIVGALLGAALLALAVYTILGWAGVIPIRGFNA